MGPALVAALVGAAIVLTHVEFPSRYFDLINEQTGVILVVAARNVLLLAALVVLVRTLATKPPGGYPGRTASSAKGTDYGRAGAVHLRPSRQPDRGGTAARPTTLAVGEEDDGPHHDAAVGEEDDDDPTTLAIGEEGDDGGDEPTTLAVGEEGDEDERGPTTLAVGEED